MLDVEYVTKRLAIGSSIRTPECMQELARLGFTHVVNMQIEFDNRKLSEGTGIQVLWNGIEDDMLPKPSEFFWNGVRFALSALQNPESKILFHCAMGIHRSPLMLLAVLRVLGHGEEEAIGMIAGARPQVGFPPLYLASLDEFLIEYEALANMELPPLPEKQADS